MSGLRTLCAMTAACLAILGAGAVAASAAPEPAPRGTGCRCWHPPSHHWHFRWRF